MDTPKQEKTKKAGLVHTLEARDVGYDRKDIKVSPRAISMWIRSLRQDWRQGTVGIKNRSEVAYSTRKPWKQKGTGRARAGTARSPLWRGGGVIFGPRMRVKTLKVPRRVKQHVLRYLAHDFLTNKKVLNVDWHIEGEKPSTAQASRFLKDTGLQNKKIVLFVPMDDFITYASFSNIPQVKVLFFDQANAYDLMNADYWVFLNKDAERFKEMASRWI